MAYANHSTAQLIENYNNSQVSYRIQISYLETQHIFTSQTLFMRCQTQQQCIGHNHTQNIVMLIINT